MRLIVGRVAHFLPDMKQSYVADCPPTLVLHCISVILHPSPILLNGNLVKASLQKKRAHWHFFFNFLSLLELVDKLSPNHIHTQCNKLLFCEHWMWKHTFAFLVIAQVVPADERRVDVLILFIQIHLMFKGFLASISVCPSRSNTNLSIAATRTEEMFIFGIG